MATVLFKSGYTMDVLRDEVRALVEEKLVKRQQPIYMVCQYITDREWECFEAVLQEHEFLLRDRIIDILAQETWRED